MDLMLHNQVKPAVNQIETHPFHQQVAAHEFLQKNAMQIESWGPFAEGKNNIFQNEVLRSIAAKQGKTVAQVILRWLTQRGVVAIPKSVRKERIAENFAIFDFELRPDDMSAIAALDTKETAFFDHRDPQTVKWISEAVRPTQSFSRSNSILYMKHVILLRALTLIGATSLSVLHATAAESASEPIVIQKQGSFAVGGSVVTAPGTFDPIKHGAFNPSAQESAGQTLRGDHAYVFYQIPVNARPLPLVMWHGF